MTCLRLVQGRHPEKIVAHNLWRLEVESSVHMAQSETYEKRRACLARPNALKCKLLGDWRVTAASSAKVHALSSLPSPDHRIL